MCAKVVGVMLASSSQQQIVADADVRNATTTRYELVEWLSLPAGCYKYCLLYQGFAFSPRDRNMTQTLNVCVTITNVWQYCITVWSTDARVDDWWLMQSPMLVAIIITLYAITGGRAGRLFVQRFNVPPLTFLKPFIIAYNICMVAVSGYIAYTVFDADRTLQYQWTCEPLSYRTDALSMRVAGACHLFCITKLIELLDTVFIMAMHQWRRLSFLHIFHHSSMLANGWLIARFFATGNAAHSVMVNSSVHCLMYSYYALAATASLTGRTGQFQISLYAAKKSMTLAQMLQFFVGLTLGSIAVFVRRCQYPVFAKVLGLSYTLSMVVLFGNFYYHAYIKKKSSSPTYHEKAAKVFNDSVESKKMLQPAKVLVPNGSYKDDDVCTSRNGKQQKLHVIQKTSFGKKAA